MKWNVEDLAVFRQEKEYVDTVLIPFVPIHWGEEMTGPVTAGRFATLLAEETEHQLRGRVILSPPFTYLKQEPQEKRRERILEWVKTIQAYGVAHIVCLTSDPDWNPLQTEDVLPGLTYIWLPALPIEHMDPKHRQDYIDDNVGQVLKKMMKAWQAN